ncbi:early nodulin-like protein 3 [Vicia villosa]|uniref:early nodulin-like protein 3 n=1 Tax=Vicia villosa TaxID=3911 RepID=UPI00273C2173|nr:early nodulin-like protein 3 [Vicia villosa]
MAMMKSGFILFMSMLFLISSLSYGYKFNVGGKDGWAVKPSQCYSQWAQKNRFQINDTLYFKYNKGSDSVLVVNYQDYNSCNTNNPILKLDGGNSIFKFDRSGPFFFISGNVENCQKGEKLIVVVLSPNHNRKHNGPSSSPSPADSPAENAPSNSTVDNAPAKSPASSGSTMLSGSIIVSVGLVLVLGSFVF